MALDERGRCRVPAPPGGYDPATKEFMNKFRETSIKPDAIARAIAFAVEQAADVDVSEIIVRPTASAF